MTTTTAAPAVTPQQILELGFAWWGSTTLHSAIELRVFETLAAAGPLDAQELCARTGMHRRGARDFLDALVAFGFLHREDQRYELTPESAAFLDPRVPGYVGDFILMAARRPSWPRLTEALRSGLPQHGGAAGDDFFDAVYPHPDKLAEFLKAMTANAGGTAQALAHAFPWQRYGSVVDVGCAEGVVPVTLAHAHPHLRCGGFDLPLVRPHFERFAERAGAAGRVGFIAGDFFADPLPAADVLVMGHVLHDWDLPRKRLLIEKAYAALPEGGALVVYETLIDDERRENAFALLMSLNMLVESRGGFDFTGSDCENWMRDAGFGSTRVEHLNGPVAMVVAEK